MSVTYTSVVTSTGALPASTSGLNARQGDCVLAHIEAELDAPLRATDLAALAHLSSSHFCRAFKARFGQPPHAYVLRRRVERAKCLMVSGTPQSLADIALTCGLSDQSHLTRVFRQITGESPGAWRQRQPRQ